ncbi:MAG: hypothetical protein ACTSQH_07785 [Candidatus Hodarchaeales archaeon]
MKKQNSSSEEKVRFRLSKKIGSIFVILLIIPVVPIAIGFMVIFDQMGQQNIVYTTMTGQFDARYTINLESNTMYYITVSPSDRMIVGDFSGELYFFKDSLEIYHDTTQKPADLIIGGISFAFKPFISETEGSYIIDCSITYSDNIFPFYIKMQKAAGISQITGYSGEEILGIGMIIFLALLVLLIIVAVFARVKWATRLGKLASKSEEPQNKFVWSSKDENNDT